MVWLVVGGVQLDCRLLECSLSISLIQQQVILGRLGAQGCVQV